MSHMTRFPILSLLMKGDQLAHLYITGFKEYNKGLTSTLYESHDHISRPLGSQQDDQLGHLYLTGFHEYNKRLNITVYESHDKISCTLRSHAG
jgi:hypothetical protein